jgi:hypothetical protein
VTEQMSIPHVEALSASIEEALVRAFGPDTLDYERYKSAKDFDNDPFNYAYEVRFRRSSNRSRDQRPVPAHYSNGR